MGFGAWSRCSTAIVLISFGDGTKVILSWVDGQHPDDCSEMQPTQRALQDGEVGIGASQRPRK